MPKYTFITNFQGGTYICQKDADDLRKGFVLWSQDIFKGGYIPNLDPKAFCKAFELDIDELPPQPLDTLQNIWLFHLMLGEDEMMDVHIVKTDTQG